jgi:hypothetical protein
MAARARGGSGGKPQSPRVAACFRETARMGVHAICATLAWSRFHQKYSLKNR